MPLIAGGPGRGQDLPCVEIVAYVFRWMLKSCVMKLHHLLAACLLSLPANARELAIGEKVPDCELTDANGKTLNISRFRGRALAVTFIFTRCPLPDFCPRLSSHFKAAQQELAKTGKDDWHLLSLSFDPEHDSAQQLTQYAKAQGADATHWTFATGNGVREFGASAGLEVMIQDGLINHNLRTLVVDAAGRVQCIFKGSDWTAQDLVWEMQKAMPAKE